MMRHPPRWWPYVGGAIGAVVGWLAGMYLVPDSWFDRLPDPPDVDRPSIPPPPDWVERATATFLAHAADPLYWALALASFLVWGVLRWQRKPGQTRAAKSFRMFIFSKGWLWLVLAVTRWIAPLWRLPLYALVVVYIAIATLYVLLALVLTYVAPAIRGGDRPEHGPIEEVLPVRRAERRVGPPERRRDWPPPTVGT